MSPCRVPPAATRGSAVSRLARVEGLGCYHRAKFNEAQLAFIRRISDVRKPWMAVREHAGFEAVQGLIADLHAGRIDPSTGHVVVLD